MATDTAPAEPGIPAEAEGSRVNGARVLQWILWGWAAVEAALLAGAPLLFGDTLNPPSLAETIEFAAWLISLGIAVMAFATAGLLVTRQQPGNAVGWTMLAGGPALGAVFVGYVIGAAILETEPIAGAWSVLFGVVLFGPALFLIGPGLASVFPNGRALGGWWTRALWVAAVGIALGSILAAVAPGPVEAGIDVANPMGVGALPSELRDVANGVTALALINGGLVAVASLVVRYRRSAEEARHQLKWFLFAVAVWVVVLPISLIVGDNWTASIGILALALVPVAVLVAIRRYRLYEIDVLINRTFVYVPLVGIVAGLYAGLVALLQRLFTAVTGNTSDAAAIISALALAAVFTPMRNAIQAAVDRRFKPENADAGTKWDDPEFRAAVEAIVRGMDGRSSKSR